MSDPYHEHEDRMLLEEHAEHPERFHRYEMKNPDKMTNKELRAYVKHLLSMIHTLQTTIKKLKP